MTETFRKLILGLGLIHCATVFNATAADPNGPERPTVFLIGDSTVNTPTKGVQGWGTPIASFFDSAKINVENRARGGRSSRTYFTEELWEQVRSNLKIGDFVLMQFGHNDGGLLAEGRAR